MAITKNDVEGLISQMTVEEKISLLAGASMWRSAAIPRLGVPNIKTSDGPSGARGEVFGEGVPAAFLPVGVSLGATWDRSLLYQMGQLLGEETKSKSASVILSPTICLARNPLGGRNFETYGEDPFHVGALGASLVQGVQSEGIGATPKHYIANDQEIDRFHGNRVIPTRALRECYLKPFQTVVRDADPWCMMTAYNKVNGIHCDASRLLLTDIPRKEWGWNGLFMSDWGGTTSIGPSINAGLDLEMPGPPAYRQRQVVKDLLAKGDVDSSCIDASARRLLHLLQRAGRFENPQDNGETTLNHPHHIAQLRHAARSGIVLLKNENHALPIQPTEKIKKLAIVGPNSKRVVAGGGGSAYIKAPYWTSVFDSVKTEFESKGTEVLFHVGAKVNRYIPAAPSTLCKDPENSQGGAAIDWFSGHDLTSKRLCTTHIDDLYYMSFGNVPPEIGKLTDFCYRLRTTLTPLTTGRHKVSLAAIGPATLFIDGKPVLKESGDFPEDSSLFFSYGSEETIIEYDLTAGREYQISIEGHSHDRQLDDTLAERMRPMEDKFHGVRFGYEEFSSVDLPAEAAAIAQDCDAAIVVVGRDKEWETEGQDIPQWELPGNQARLIEEISKVCSRTIVVVQAGTPVKLEPWIHHVSGVLYAWYQGQELGNAAADVICGYFNPSGRTPVTFPRHIEHAPGIATPLEPGADTASLYGEGIHVGHRWWDFLGVEPLFPLGFGLSYSTFELSDLSISDRFLTASKPIKITARITNTGGALPAARQTLLAFYSPSKTQRLSRPKKQLCGFGKSAEILTGESSTVEISIDAYGFGAFDPQSGKFVIDGGSVFDILLGAHAGDTKVIGQVEVQDEISWVHRIGGDLA